MYRSVDDLGKYAGKSPVHMWTSGAVDMWITVAARSPCRVPGLSLTPPGDHPAAGMCRSRRPGAARLRCAGERNGARRWPRPDRKSSDAPYPGCANEPRPGPAAQPGHCGQPDRSPGSRTALTPSGPLSSGRAAAQQERDTALSGAGRRAGEAESRVRNAGQDAARTREAAGSAHAELDRARQGRGPAGGPGPRGCRTGPSQTASGVRSPDRGGRERPRRASGPRQARRG